MKHLLVTGGANGIGKAIVAEGLKRGYQVDIFDLEYGNDITKPIDCDITPDILINCAGITRRGTITDDNIIEQTREVLETNLYGTINMIRWALGKMKQGSIVNIGSKSAFRPSRNRFAYCISKGAIVSLTKQLALELAPMIRVNSVSPGIVDTKMPESDVAISALTNNLLKRKGKPEEIAKLVLDVAENEYITGQDFIIDGGFSLL